VLYALAILYLFLGVAIVCDDFFTASLERICLRLRLSEDVAGATFMAAGSSAPELFTSTMSLVSSNATNELGVATIVGSAVFNILVIVAATTVFSTKKNEPLRLDWKPVTRDCAFYAAAVASVLLVMADGKVWWWEGVACVCMYATYVAFMAVNEKVMRSMDAWAERRRLAGRDKNAFFFSRVANAQANLFAKKKNKVGAEALSPERPTGVVEAADDVEAARDATRPTRLGGEDDAIEHTVSAALEATVADLEREEETRYAAVSELLKKAPPFSRDDARDTRDAALDETCASAGGPFTRPAAARDVPLWLLSLPWYLAFTYTIPDCEHPRRARGNAYLVSFGASVAWISAISYGMVDCASRVGCALDIPEVVMGTLVLAAGTSVPDALASVSVARGGAGDMAVANAVGSNVFDIWLGLGLPWAAFLPTRGNGDPRAMFEPVSTTQLWPSVCILAGVLLVYYASVAASGFALTKSHGYFFLFVYFLFAAYSVFGVWWLDVYELRSGTEAA
jgi:K+-dependent Na+/Ca+ exchanger-like protein